jgi:hypothetical protein
MCFPKGLEEKIGSDSGAIPAVKLSACWHVHSLRLRQQLRRFI